MYGFTGELTDSNGLLYLRARYLAPGLGTFVSRDPWRGSAPRTATRAPILPSPTAASGFRGGN